jgi:hypothetical protein
VWGNIRKFLATDEILESHDVVSARRRRIAGTCTLYRNANELNRLFSADRRFESSSGSGRTSGTTRRDGRASSGGSATPVR